MTRFDVEGEKSIYSNIHSEREREAVVHPNRWSDVGAEFGRWVVAGIRIDLLGLRQENHLASREKMSRLRVHVKLRGDGGGPMLIFVPRGAGEPATLTGKQH